MTATFALPIKETIKSAWEKVHGAKATFWKAMVLGLIILCMAHLVTTQLGRVFPAADAMLKVMVKALAFLFQMSFIYMGIKRAQKEAYTWRALFKSIEGYTPLHLIALYLFQLCIVLIPLAILLGATFLYQSDDANLRLLGMCIFFLGIIFIYYLLLRMMMSVALVLDKGQLPWEAIKQSFQLTRGNVLRLLVISIFQYLVFIVSALSVIGLIWGYPFCFILYGVIYMRLMRV